MHRGLERTAGDRRDGDLAEKDEARGHLGPDANSERAYLESGYPTSDDWLLAIESLIADRVLPH